MLSGIFVMNTNTHQNPEIFATPGLTGVLISLGWSDLVGPTGVIDWEPLDTAINQVPSNLQISLAIAAGLQAPNDYLKTIPGMPTIPLTINAKVHGPAVDLVLPVPFAPQFVFAYMSFIQEVYSHLVSTKQIDRVVAIRDALYSSRDSEMQIMWTDSAGPLPSNALAWAKAGFRPSTANEVWTSYTQFLLNNFSHTTAIQALLTPNAIYPWVDNNGNVLIKNNSTETIEALIANAGSLFGNRICFMDTALSTVPVNSLFTGIAKTGAMFVAQTNAWGGPKGAMTGPHTNPIPGTQEGFESIFKNMQSFGIKYAEVHGSDVELWGKSIVNCAAILAE